MKRSKKLLIGTGAVAAGMAAVAGVSYYTAKTLMKIALDREEPKCIEKTKQRLSGSETHSVLLAKLNAAAATLEQSGCETIEITAQDGETLVGHWYACANPERVIIAMHGWRSSWAKDFGAVADFWHRQNCNVLYVEQRGQNNSGGEYMGFGLMERYDCLDWIDWVNENNLCEVHGKDIPLYLSGVSMGATSVLMAAGMGLPANVKGIMADCGFTSPHEIWQHIAEKNLHLSFGLCGEIADEICKNKIQMSGQEYSSVEAMKQCTVPVLFIHGAEDRMVPIEMTYENYKACAAPKRLFVVPGAEHGMSYFTDTAGYQKEMLEFWRDFH